jgi:hypothetical protein
MFQPYRYFAGFGRAARTRLFSIINMQNGALLTSLLPSLFAYLYVFYLAPGEIKYTYMYREIPRINCLGKISKPKEKNDNNSSFAMCCESIGGIYKEHKKTSFHRRISTLLHLPPLNFHCVGGCWDQTQDSCNFSIGTQTLKPIGYGSHLI